MSWWVKEISTITEDQSERLCIIETDTPNDLPNPVRTKPDPDNPGQTITDYTIVRGSEAYCLSNSKTYKLNSQGNWVEQTDGSGGGGGASSADQVSYDNTDSGLTATNVQDAIDELHDTDDTQDRALAELYGMDANQQLEINYSINTGSKNKLENTVAVGTQTIRGVDVTVNADGSVDIGTGTVTGGNLDLHINTSAGAGMVNGGSYILSGCPQGGSSSTYRLNCTGIGYETGEGKEFVYSGGALDVYLRVYSGQTISTPLHFAPMIRNAVIRNSTFEPYAKTNVDLTNENENQQLEIDYAINTGSKNKLIITNQNNTLTVNGITFTKNDDQTITATGTATANADYPLNITQPLEIGQSYTLSGCPNGGGENNFLLRQLGGAIDYGDGATFTAESSSSNFYIRIRNGYAIQGSITFKPMIRAAEIKSTTFEPYAPTNRELYETKLTANDVWGYGQLIPDSADLNDYTTGGKFYGGNTAGNTVSNLPIANGSFTFTLEVKLATPSMTYQYLRVCRNADDPYIYIRRKYTTWGTWYRFTGEAVVASVQSLNSPMTLNLNRNDLNEQLDSNFDLIDSIPEEEEGEEDD